MSIQLLPNIGELDKDSLCYSIYIQLYNNFFNAQDSGTITEGDINSIRLHNTAYGFADAIAGSVDGGTGEGGVLIDYLKKSGGDMSGHFRANYGFEAGIGNTPLITTYFEDNKYGVRLNGDLRVGGDNLYIGNRQLLSYNSVDGVAKFNAPVIEFGSASLKSSGEMLFGVDKKTGVSISATTIHIKGNEVYHKGNANLSVVDWTMKDATIAGVLNIKGVVTLSAELRALNGFRLGVNNNTMLYSTKDGISADAFLSFGASYGIKIGEVPVLVRVNDGDIQLSSSGADLLLGSDKTNKIRLFAGLCDIDGDNILISKYGAAYFPDSLRVRHNYGADLLSSYRTDSIDEGMIIHKRLRFGSSSGAILSGDDSSITFSSLSLHHKTDKDLYIICRTHLSHQPSTSRYKPLDRDSDSTYISTSADFVTFNKPLEALDHIGIDGSYTRLTDKALYFTNESYIQSIEGGIKHYGNSIFTKNLSSEYFASGFAGAGWSILHNRTTGNTSATFDELTIRKKMRIYELEVQKLSATNGALWVSDSCSGDTVIELQ